jgi:hypothetical protein
MKIERNHGCVTLPFLKTALPRTHQTPAALAQAIMSSLDLCPLTEQQRCTDDNPVYRQLTGQVDSGHRMTIAVLRKAAKFLEMGAELAEEWVHVQVNILSFSSQHLLTHCRMCTRSGH